MFFINVYGKYDKIHYIERVEKISYYLSYTQEKGIKMNNNPKEFISFSHDNLVFENKILEFANRLCSEGIDANVERGI